MVVLVGNLSGFLMKSCFARITQTTILYQSEEFPPWSLESGCFPTQLASPANKPLAPENNPILVCNHFVLRQFLGVRTVDLVFESFRACFSNKRRTLKGTNVMSSLMVTFTQNLRPEVMFADLVCFHFFNFQL